MVLADAPQCQIKEVCLTSKCHRHIPETNPQHREEEVQNTDSHMTARAQGSKENLSLEVMTRLGFNQPDTEVVKLVSCSTQQSMKFQLLIEPKLLA